MTFEQPTAPNTLGRIRMDDGRIAVVRQEGTNAVIYWQTPTHNRFRDRSILTAFVLWYLRPNK